jgi:hypothetical protein
MKDPPEDRGVQRGELLSPTGITWRSFPEQVRARSACRCQEDDALLLEILADLVVDDLGFVLGRDSRDQPLLLRLRDAQPVVGVLDVGRQLNQVAVARST